MQQRAWRGVVGLCLSSVMGCGGEEAGEPQRADAGTLPVLDAAVVPTTPDAARDASSVPPGLPCEVAAIVREHCASCHGTAPAYGAPMSLVTPGDFAGDVRDGSRSVVEAVRARLYDDRSPMPPTSQAALDGAELDVLDAWLADGAPGANVQCNTVDAGVDAAAELPACAEPYEFRAHGESKKDDDTPFAVPLKDDRYECFTFGVPWTGKRQGLRFDALIDDSRVVHHWLVYAVAGSDFEDGKVYDCSGQHPNSQLLAGWAPGREPVVMPEDVGLRLPEGESGHFVLEIHYNNSAGHEDVRDRSGARLCVTDELRKNEAAVHWLGTENITLMPGAAAKALGSCSPAAKATILNTWPHMHDRGRHMTTIIERAGGGQEVLVDKPFSFADQVSYDVKTEVGPGDKLRTTCSFMNDTTSQIGFGTGTGDEMCYNFVLAYPAGALSSSLGFSLTGAQGTCIDVF